MMRAHAQGKPDCTEALRQRLAESGGGAGYRRVA